MLSPCVVDLRTSSGRRLGVGESSPQLGWAVQGAREVVAYRLQLACDDGFTDLIADTGEQLDATWSWVPWPFAPLTSRERVHWRVQVRTERGWTDWTATDLEAGLLDATDWIARPIAWVEDLGGREPGPSPRFAAPLVLGSTPIRGRLYVTALGLVEPSINGRPVSPDVFAPGWSSFGTRLAYDTYDVTDLLHEGTNELAALLGDGWYRGALVWGDARHRCHYGDRVALLAQLEATLADGSTIVLATGDDGWTVRDSEVRSADIYDGCSVDLTNAPMNGTVEVLDLDLRNRLFVRQGPPVRRTQVLPGRREGAIVDFGQNLAGWVRLRVLAEQGQKLVVRHAEVLGDDGRLLTSPLRTARATDTWVLAGGEHVLEPRFTFHGFRYAEITTEAEVLEIEAVAVHSDLERSATFSCSDPRLERLHSNVVWGQRGNFLSVPTDCPQRDERLGWTGDAQVFAATAGLLHDTRGFFADWLGDLRAEQVSDGRVPIVVPNVLGADWSGIAGWSDAACIVPWAVAVRSGDLGVLRASLPSMRRWVDWAHGQRTDGVWVGSIQLGDWLDPDAPQGDPWAAKADSQMVANAVVVHSVRLLVDALEVCGEPSSDYRAMAESWAEKTWERWGHVARTTQTGCALFLRFGLVPASERSAVAQDLADLVLANEGRIGTGFLGTPEVLYALSDAGHLDAAYRLLLCNACPSWLYQVEHGATTMWERWDAVLPEGGVALGKKSDDDPGMLSFNHYAYGAVAAWMHEVLAGLVVRELPNPSLTVAPRPGGGITHASASLTTPRGKASVTWTIEGDELVLMAQIPPGYQARLDPPPEWDIEPQLMQAGQTMWRVNRR